MRFTTAEKLQRLISIVSWINAHDGPTVAEVCDRFAIDPADLVAQLDMASLVGAESDDYGDMPIEVYYEDDRVYVHVTSFQRPLRLTPEQGLALLAAGVGRQNAASLDPDGPLARALAKVAGVLGFDPADTIEVDLGDADAAVLDRLRAAVAATTPVELDYTSAGRDRRTHRVVEPWRVFNERGAWYLQAWCRKAEGERLFRVDRIHGVQQRGRHVHAAAPHPPARAFQGRRRGSTDRARPRAGCPLGRDHLPDRPGRRTARRRACVTMPAGGPAFLARLLLTLGANATVVGEGDRSDGNAIVVGRGDADPGPVPAGT